MLITIFSCKEEKKGSEINHNIDQENKKVDEKGYFSLHINAIVEHNEKFTLFYLDVDQENITKENSVSLNVEGNAEPQDLVFQLTNDILPTRLILRFGNEAKTQKIYFNNTELSYHNSKINIEKENFFQFFNPNKFIDYKRDELLAITKEVEGNYNPAFFSRRILEDKIEVTFF